MSKLSRRTFVITTAIGFVVPNLLKAQSQPMRLLCKFGEQEFTYQLFDNATVQDFVSMLPLDLIIEDFSTNEKIAHLPRRLDEGGHEPIGDETPGDLCYFLGWGNLAFFYNDYEYRNDLIRLGRIEGPVDPLLVRGRYQLRLELVT